MQEVEYISLQQVRRNLAGFFHAVNAGQMFAVYQHSQLLAMVGKIADAEKSADRWCDGDRVFDQSAYLSELFDILGDARLEMQAHQELRLRSSA